MKVTLKSFLARFQKTLIFPIGFNDFMELRCQLGATLGSLWGTLGSLWRLLADFFVKEASSGRPFRPKCVEYTLFRRFSRGGGNGRGGPEEAPRKLQGSLREAPGRQWCIGGSSQRSTKVLRINKRSTEDLTRR